MSVASALPLAEEAVQDEVGVYVETSGKSKWKKKVVIALVVLMSVGFLGTIYLFRDHAAPSKPLLNVPGKPPPILPDTSSAHYTQVTVSRGPMAKLIENAKIRLRNVSTRNLGIAVSSVVLVSALLVVLLRTRLLYSFSYFFKFSVDTDVEFYFHVMLTLGIIGSVIGGYYSIISHHEYLHNPRRYKLLKVLGEGAYGKVHKAIDTYTQLTVAIKVIDMTRSWEAAKVLAREAHIMRLLSAETENQYFPTFYDLFRDGDNGWLVMEFIEGVSLDKLCQIPKLVSDTHLAAVTKQVLQGLAVMHSQRIVHRDIKGANLMVTKAGLVKIIDYGFATQLSYKLTRKSWTGSGIFMPPESLNRTEYTELYDVWSVGILNFLAIADPYPRYFKLEEECKQRLFQGQSKGSLISEEVIAKLRIIFEKEKELMMEKLKEGKLSQKEYDKKMTEKLPEQVKDELLVMNMNDVGPELDHLAGRSQELQDFVKSVLVKESMRPTAFSLLKHPYIVNVKDEQRIVQELANIVNSIPDSEETSES